ncbi:MAG: glycosyltransferase family 2 protein [Acidobacteriaceae bacterium]
MAERPTIGVVTVTYNSANILNDFLRCTSAQTYRNILIYAIDNASQDSTLELLRAWDDPRLKVIANPDNRGVAKANNQGIQAAMDDGCGLILLINNDTGFDPQLFELLADGLYQQKSDMVCPKILYFDEPSRIWAAGGAFQPLLGFRNYHRGENQEDIGQFNDPCLVDYAPTCCILIRRDVFSQIGLMDERYFVYSDDSDFLLRARRQQLRMFFIPKAKLWHKVSSLTGGLESEFTCYHAARGRALFLYKNLGRVRGEFWIVMMHLLYIVRPLLGKDTKKRCDEKRRGLRDGEKLAVSIHKRENRSIALEPNS